MRNSIAGPNTGGNKPQSANGYCMRETGVAG